MNIKKVIRLLTIIAPLTGVNTEQIKVVLAILNLIAEETAEATK